MIFNSWKIRRKVPEDKTLFMKEKYEKESTNIIAEETFETNSSPSLLGKEIKILGKISSTGALQLDGVLEGEIKASKLVIERSAKVVGSVTSEDLVIKGRIIGPVFGKKVRFGASARVEGDTFHETIAIEDGAYYEGSIRRQSNVSDTPNTATNDKLAKNN